MDQLTPPPHTRATLQFCPNFQREIQMKLNHITAAAALALAFSAAPVFAQGTTSPTSPSRDAVQADAITSHKDGTMQHGEAAAKTKAFKSSKTRKEVRAEAINSHKDGTMVHNEAGQDKK